VSSSGGGKRNILVLGASGMLGRAVFHVLRERTGWNITGTQNNDPNAPGYMDLFEMPEERWRAVIQQQPHDYIVNCIGILKPAVNEKDPKSLRRAILVNAAFPHQLAEIVPTVRIVHMSTDGVFSGGSSRPYLETDPTDCPDAYGKSKALGECPGSNVLNIRCSIIGRDPVGHKGLIEWVLGRPAGSEIPGFENQMWNGVTTTQFGRLCRNIFESGSFNQIRATSHIHHFCPNPPITKYALLDMICTTTGSKVRIGKASGPGNGSVLGTIFNELGRLHSNCPDWLPVLREALAEW
jgi:dTDP-4-dehydrorhamnose reductase